MLDFQPTESRIVTHTEAQRIAKAWGSRLPNIKGLLYKGETVADAAMQGGHARLYRDSLYQWRLERGEFVASAEKGE